MPSRAQTANSEKSSHRLSVSLTNEQYAQLSEIAHINRVSIAWVTREAIERLLKDDMPLFHISDK